jgi:hypothetical protein
MVRHSFSHLSQCNKQREQDVVGPEGGVHVSRPIDSPTQATQGVNDLPMGLAPVSQVNLVALSSSTIY